jgi:hypothetical protein
MRQARGAWGMLAPMIKTILSAGVPFGLAMGLFFGLQRGALAGLVAGTFAGLLFGVLLAAFVEGQRRRLEIRSGVLDGEKIVRQGPANHWRGVEARGGWLVLTERRLVFTSHGKNVQNQGAEVRLDAITAVEPASSLGIVPNGLRVRHGDDAVEKFVVTERGAWLVALARGVTRAP